MISIKKDFASVPDKLNTDERADLIKRSLTEKNKHDFKSKVYRDGTLKELENLYYHKCGYCETDTTAGAPMQVEHYRPKAKVSEVASHEGYYWVAYEWSNLLLSCAKCNNKKRNRFPVQGVRMTTPVLDTSGLPNDDCRLANSANFQREKALLLHPEIDQVEDFFIFKPDGTIEALNSNPRALKTIEICELNRTDLVIKRFTILDDFFRDIKDILEDLLIGKIDVGQCRYALYLIFRKIVLLQKPENQYSRFGFFMFSKFEQFFANRLPAKQGEAVKKLFQLFLEKKLE